MINLIFILIFNQICYRYILPSIKTFFALLMPKTNFRSQFFMPVKNTIWQFLFSIILMSSFFHCSVFFIFISFLALYVIFLSFFFIIFTGHFNNDIIKDTIFLCSKIYDFNCLSDWLSNYWIVNFFGQFLLINILGSFRFCLCLLFTQSCKDCHLLFRCFIKLWNQLYHQFDWKIMPTFSKQGAIRLSK